MSSKVNLLKKRIAVLQAQLEVEMAKNSKVSEGTLPIGKRKTIVKRTSPKVIGKIKRPTLIGKVKEHKVKYVTKKPTIIGEIKTRKVIKRLKLIGKPTLRKTKRTTIIIDTIDWRKRYFNPVTQNYVLRPTYLAALPKIKTKDEELEQKFDEASQKIEKKINA